MLRLGASLLAVGLALSATRPAVVEPLLTLSVRPVPLNPADPDQVRLGRLRYRGGLELRSVEPRFGGLSDLRVLDGGRRLVSVSDCGTALLADLRYDERGNLGGMSEPRLQRLVAPGGRPLAAGEEDAESMALAPDGAIITGFEQRHRLWRYPPGAGPFTLAPDPLQPPPGSAALDADHGFEAALSFEDGRLLLLSEALRGQKAALGWIEKGAVWEEFALPLLYLDDAPDEPFRPTALALLPGGDVAVLERRYPPMAVRIRRLARAALENGRDLTGEELARFAPPLTTDNYEGLEVSMGPDGLPRVFVLSDDNDCAKLNHRHGTSGQRTLLLSFTIGD
jgi:hypothetical protein